jgi:hypothetical protein
MAIYEQLCGCVVEMTKGETRITSYCDEHKGVLSFGRAWQPGVELKSQHEQAHRFEPSLTTGVRYMAPGVEPEVSPLGVPKQGKSMLGRFADALFGDIEIRSVRPDPTDMRGMPTIDDAHSHTLCDEQVDFLNLTLSRERTELLEERRKWVMLRAKDRVCGANRITEIDAELEMIDGITLKLRRQS